MTTANGILAVLKAWDGTCSPDELFSMGVLCPGEDTTQPQTSLRADVARDET